MDGGVVVCGRVFTPEVIERMRRAVDEHPDWTRCRLAHEVCGWLDWRSANGRRKEMSCRKALLRLDKRGLIKLPPAKRQVYFGGKSCQQVQLDVPDSLSVELSEIKELELVLVRPGQRALSAQWNTLVSRHHYLGYRPLSGAQLRYLIRSEYGWLGALGFRSATLRSQARDRWIGWSDEARQAYLPQVVCNARFVIATGVQVKNLASTVLARATERLPTDWEAAYGVVPLLVETYVDTTRFAGTCYRAANWQAVGTTRGGRPRARGAAGEKSRKAIFAWALRRDFRERLCEEPGPARLPEVAQRRRRAAAAQRAPADWVEREFHTAQLTDQRLAKRLRLVARSFHEQPQANIPQACGSASRTKAAYRFFKTVGMQPILTAHFAATLERVAAHPPAVVLAVNDSTSVNYSAHPGTEGLGPISNTGHKTLGLWMHDTMVYDPQGTALGLIDVQLWARDATEKGKAARRYERPIEAKESGKWMKSFAAAARLQRQLGSQTMVVSVGDREADIYELFVQALSDPAHPKLLVRADCGERLLAADGQKVRDFVARQPMADQRHTQIPRHQGRPARLAELQVRCSAVALRAPKRHPRLGVVELWVVYVTEVNAPAGVVPIEWMLWTTVAVTTAAHAWEKVDWYKRRWGIEEFHRTLKSGCRIEDRQLGDVASLQSCLAVDLVVAWRIEHVKKLSRQTPDEPCTVVFTDAESQVLAAKYKPAALTGSAPLGLREAVRLTAQLGGFLGRKSDGEPGAITLWRGLVRLKAMVDGWLLARELDLSHELPMKPTVFGRGDSG